MAFEVVWIPVRRFDRVFESQQLSAVGQEPWRGQASHLLSGQNPDSSRHNLGWFSDSVRVVDSVEPVREGVPVTVQNLDGYDVVVSYDGGGVVVPPHFPKRPQKPSYAPTRRSPRSARHLNSQPVPALDHPPWSIGGSNRQHHRCRQRAPTRSL